MPTADCFRTDTGLIVFVTGAAKPPTVHDQENDNSLELTPARLDFLGVAGSITAAAEHTGAWWGELPHDRSEARLTLEVDGATWRACVAPDE